MVRRCGTNYRAPNWEKYLLIHRGWDHGVVGMLLATMRWVWESEILPSSLRLGVLLTTHATICVGDCSQSGRRDPLLAILANDMTCGILQLQGPARLFCQSLTNRLGSPVDVVRVKTNGLVAEIAAIFGGKQLHPWGKTHNTPPC